MNEVNKANIASLYLQISDAYEMLSNEYKQEKVEQDMVDELKRIIAELLSQAEKESKK